MILINYQLLSILYCEFKLNNEEYYAILHLTAVIEAP